MKAFLHKLYLTFVKDDHYRFFLSGLGTTLLLTFASFLLGTALGIALCAALIFAWGVSNAGTAVRHREKFMTVYILLIALCGDSRTTRIKTLREAEN